MQTLNYLSDLPLGLLTLIYHSHYHLLQAQLSNAFGIIATSIFQQIARHNINVTNAQNETRLQEWMVPISWSGEQKGEDLREP